MITEYVNSVPSIVLCVVLHAVVNIQYSNRAGSKQLDRLLAHKVAFHLWLQSAVAHIVGNLKDGAAGNGFKGWTISLTHQVQSIQWALDFTVSKQGC